MCIQVQRSSGSGGSRRKSIGPQLEVRLCIWCMNAAVAFSQVPLTMSHHALLRSFVPQIARVCRSVILTSGTLSPLSSFASELGTEFKFRLESRHVVDMEKQVALLQRGNWATKTVR